MVGAAATVPAVVADAGAKVGEFDTMSALEPALPTATTVPLLRAVAPKSSPPDGLLMMLQLVPSQCSLNQPASLPTAQISLAEIVATPDRLLVTFGFGFGLETMLQLVPSQCS